jgi:hypothetical protein
MTLSPYDLTDDELTDQLDEMGADLNTATRMYDSDLVHAAADRVLARARAARLQATVSWVLAACLLAALLGWGVASRDGRDCMNAATLELEVCP